jgi:hypothetical protein
MMNTVSTCSTWDEAEEVISEYPILNMLNTKYIIIQPDGAPLVNEAAFGNAWFCSDLFWVSTPDEEIAALKEVDLSKTAVLHDSFKELFKDVDGVAIDGSATLRLTKYAPNSLEFVYSSISPQLALFSDVYYPKGWKAWIDDTPIEIARANYILRALPLPQGSHTIRFAFAPESYQKGATWSRISSALLMLLLFVGLFIEVRHTRRMLCREN